MADRPGANPYSVVMTFRLKPIQRAALDAKARELGMDNTDLLREALSLFYLVSTQVPKGQDRLEAVRSALSRGG